MRIDWIKRVFRFLKTRRPEKVLIVHWYAPPHLIPLVDVVSGPKTLVETLETVKTLLLKLGKAPVVMKKFIPGYIVNRLQRAMTERYFIFWIKDTPHQRRSTRL